MLILPLQLQLKSRRAAFKCDARRFGSLKIEHALEQSNYRVTLIYDSVWGGGGDILRYDLRLGHEECHDLIGLSALHFQLFQSCTACGLIILLRTCQGVREAWLGLAGCGIFQF